MAESNTVFAEKSISGIQQHEDAALKISMQFFADELLPYFGIEGKVVAFAPTELVHLELKKLNQDFNMVMENGAWKHIEFQSTNEGVEGLKRFRVYESLASYQHKVDITTYVLFSGNIQNPMTEFISGMNTYRIQPIIMQHKDGDRLIEELQEKQARGEKLTKADLVPLTLCLLMGGKMPQKERVRASFAITRGAYEVDPQTIQKIEAVVYAMADKFLNRDDMDQIKEEVKMTTLGQILVEDGIAQGITQKNKDVIKIKLGKGKSIEEIADALEESVETIRSLIAEMQNS